MRTVASGFAYVAGLYGLLPRLNSVVLQSTILSMYRKMVQNRVFLGVVVFNTQLNFKLLQSTRVLKN